VPPATVQNFNITFGENFRNWPDILDALPSVRFRG